jgi:hypothetical protein
MMLQLIYSNEMRISQFALDVPACSSAELRKLRNPQFGVHASARAPIS